MNNLQYESAFDNPAIALLIGVAVSLDVIALTFCSHHIYSAEKGTWLRWAKYNAGWHAGLLLFYLLFIDIITVVSQYVGILLELDLPDWLAFIKPFLNWFSDRFRSHVIIYAAFVAMAYVWYQYSDKITSVPNSPKIKDAPSFLRPIFKKYKKDNGNIDKNSRWFWHLSACLVAVDMLALAAVVKSGEKLIQFPQGINKFETSFQELNEKIINSFNTEFLSSTIFITFAVFVVVFLLCFLSSYISKVFWSEVEVSSDEAEKTKKSVFIVVALRILEPLVIFYFIIHSMAFLVAGIPLHSPAFLLGSGFLLAALITYVGFDQILISSEKQVMSNQTKSERDQ